MSFRTSGILFIGLLLLSLSFVGFFSFHSVQQNNQQVQQHLSQTTFIFQAYLKQYMALSTTPLSLAIQSPHVHDVFKKYSQKSTQTVLLVNNSGKILAHSNRDYQGHFLPSSSPLLPWLKKGKAIKGIIDNRNSVIAIRPIKLYQTKHFIIISKPTQKWGPTFISYLKPTILIFSSGFIILYLALFFCLRYFTQAGQFLLHVFPDSRAFDSKKALSFLSHTQNPYLQQVRSRLIPLLKTPKSPRYKAPDPASCFSHLLNELIQKTNHYYPQLSLQVKKQADLNLPIYSDSLSQALWELVKNAVEASPDKAQISIQTFKKDNWFCCEVHDHGPGMDDNTKAKACKLYFSTKAKHTGMGLSFVEKLLTRLGGFVHLQSPLEGTGLIVSLLIPQDYMEHIQALKNKSHHQALPPLAEPPQHLST